MLRCKNHQDLGRCSAGAVCGSAGVDDSCNPQNFSISLILIVTTIPNLTFLSSDFLHSLKHIFLVITSNTFPLGLPYSVPCSVPYLDQLVLILLCRRTGYAACLKCQTIHRHGWLSHFVMKCLSLLRWLGRGGSSSYCKANLGPLSPSQPDHTCPLSTLQQYYTALSLCTSASTLLHATTCPVFNTMPSCTELNWTGHQTKWMEGRRQLSHILLVFKNL